MEMVLGVLQFVNLLAAALGAGGQLFCLKTFVAARRSWAPELGAKVHQDAMTVLPDDYMKPVSAIALFTGFVIAGLEFGRVGSAVTALTILGALGQAANAAISVRWEFPVNREMLSWGKGPVPESYTRLRDSWDQKHAWRTWASLFALVCFVLAALLRQRPAL